MTNKEFAMLNGIEEKKAEILIKNPGFTDWTDDPPDGWDKGNINPKELKDFYNVSVRRIYEFNILGIKFNIKGRNLIKPKFAKMPKIKKGKKYII